jgi:hypothetical protein
MRIVLAQSLPGCSQSKIWIGVPYHCLSPQGNESVLGDIAPTEVRLILLSFLLK